MSAAVDVGLNQLREIVGLVGASQDTSQAADVIARADERLALSQGHTVVAIAGSTGSGKSSLFNALTKTDLAEPGVLRPTTSRSMAVSFGDEPGALLDWLQIPARHVVDAGAWPGLVLVDLPDHDSTKASHRAEVERLVRVVDSIIWVVDPQKYADAAAHDDFLAPLSGHSDVIVVVFNKIDQLLGPERTQCVRDLSAILDAEGLGESAIYPTSTVTGEGVADLAESLSRLVVAKTAAWRKLSADVVEAAKQIRAGLGDVVPFDETACLDELSDVLFAASGADKVVDAVCDATTRNGKMATGWPMLSWLGAFRPDPMRRLGLGRSANDAPVEVSRTSLPRPTHASWAKIASAVRDIGARAGANVPESWRDPILEAGRANLDSLSDHMDEAITATPLPMGSAHWWRGVRLAQWALFALAMIGLGWMIVHAFGSALMVGLPIVPVSGSASIPLPTLLVVFGVGGGLVLAAASGFLVRAGASLAALKARKALTASIQAVARKEIVEPMLDVRARRDKAIRLADSLVSRSVGALGIM